MGLTEKEAKLLERLTRKKDEPDAPPVGRSLNISVDLGDEKQVERARKLGLFSFDDDDGADDAADDDDSADDEETPRRRGYFDGK